MGEEIYSRSITVLQCEIGNAYISDCMHMVRYYWARHREKRDRSSVSAAAAVPVSLYFSSLKDVFIAV